MALTPEEQEIADKKLQEVTEKLRKEEQELAVARSEEGKQIRDLEKQISDKRKAADAVAEQEKAKAEEWGNLTKELKEGLFSPFKAMLSAIPAPLRTIGKMVGFGAKKLFGRGGGGKSHDERQTSLLEDISKFLRPQDASKANEAALERGGGGGSNTTVINNKTIKKGGFLRGLLAGIMARGFGGGLLKMLGSMFFKAGAALLAGIGVVFSGLAKLGVMALPAAIIIYGLYSAIQVVKDYVEGYKEGGLTGAISEALGGSGEGLSNAVLQGSKWAGIGGLIGLMSGFGPVGAIVGAIVGGALGAIFGYIGGEKIKEWMDGAGAKLSVAWKALKEWTGDLVDAVAGFIYTPGGKEQGPPGTGDLSVPTVMGVHWAGLWDNISGKVSDAWTSLKEMISDLVTATGKFFYDPQIKIDEYGKTLSEGPVKIFGVALGPLWENVKQRVTDSWNGIKGWINGIIQSVADFIWTPGEAELSPSGDSIIQKPGKLFGIQLPALNDIRMLVSQRWQELMNWMDKTVKKIATFIWDKDKNELFGFKIPEIRMPEFSMPDFGEIIQGIQRKLTGGIADMLAKIPMYETALPDATVAWINANKTVQISSPKRARRSLTESRQALFDAQVAAESKVGLDAFGGVGMAQTLSQAFDPGAELEVFEGTPLSWMNWTLGEAVQKGVAKVKSTLSDDDTPIDAGMIGVNPHAGMAAIVSSQISQGPAAGEGSAMVVDASNNYRIRTDNSRRSNTYVRQKPPATPYDPHKTATYARFRGRFGGQ